MDSTYWGWNCNGSVYGVWGAPLPQIQPPLHEAVGNAMPANPYYPNTGHRACQVLMMDGSYRMAGRLVSQQTWDWACRPDDGNPLSFEWLE